MLCQFSFQNFKSYKEETTFDFQAAAIPEFSASLLGEEKSGRLLPVGVVYGPNGGGKSNLLQALSCLITTVVKPIHDLEKTREDIVIQQKAECEPFCSMIPHMTSLRSFRCISVREKTEYRYYLALKEDEVVSEALYWRAIGGRKTGTVFEREGSNITLGVSINKASINTSVNPKMPYLSFLANQL